MFFETERKISNASDRICVLLSKGDTKLTDTINAHIFIKDDKGDYNLQKNRFVITLNQNRLHSIAVRDINDDSLLYSGRKLTAANTQSLIIAHVLSSIARMHDPDFSPVTHEPPKSKLAGVLKNRFPYFLYVFMDDYGVAPGHVVLDDKPEGGISSARRYHKVKGHPRRYRDKNGNIREIVIIPPHFRGDESKGFIHRDLALRGGR